MDDAVDVVVTHDRLQHWPIVDVAQDQGNVNWNPGGDTRRQVVDDHTRASTPLQRAPHVRADVPRATGHEPRHESQARPRAFMAGQREARVGGMKSAPDLGREGLSKVQIIQFEEHLPGEVDYRFLSSSQGRHVRVRGGWSGRWGAADLDGARRGSGRRAVCGVGAVAAGRCDPVSYTHLRAHETDSYLVCRLLL